METATMIGRYAASAIACRQIQERYASLATKRAGKVKSMIEVDAV